MTRRLTRWKGTLLSAVVVAAALAAGGKAAANEAVYRRAIRGVAYVEVPGVGSGSGFLIDVQRRLLATANHVVTKKIKKDGKYVKIPVDDAWILFAQMDDKGQFITDVNYYTNKRDRLVIHGKVIRRNPQADAALIQLERLPPGVQALPLGTPEPGQNVHVIGNSSLGFGGLFSCRQGQIANLYRSPGSDLNCRVVEYDIPETHGDSGGPVINDRGEVVAIVSKGHHEVYEAYKQKDPKTGEVIQVLDVKEFHWGIDAREIKALLDSVNGSALPNGPAVPPTGPNGPALLPPAANPSLPRTGPDR